MLSKDKDNNILLPRGLQTFKGADQQAVNNMDINTILMLKWKGTDYGPVEKKKKKYSDCEYDGEMNGMG